MKKALIAIAVMLMAVNCNAGAIFYYHSSSGESEHNSANAFKAGYLEGEIHNYKEKIVRNVSIWNRAMDNNSLPQYKLDSIYDIQRGDIPALNAYNNKVLAFRAEMKEKGIDLDSMLWRAEYLGWFHLGTLAFFFFIAFTIWIVRQGIQGKLSKND